MRTPVAAFLLLSHSVALFACANTKFQSTWTAPDAVPLVFSGRKVVALVLALDDGWGRPAELALADQLLKRNVDGIAAHTVLSPSERRDPDRLKARLTQLGAAGLVLMRVTQVKSAYPSSSPAYVGTTHAGGYYDAWNDDRWNRASLRAPPPHGDTRVYVETQVYSLAPDKLLWSGKSRTKNPAGIDALINQLVEAAAVELQRAGLIAAR